MGHWRLDNDTPRLCYTFRTTQPAPATYVPKSRGAVFNLRRIPHDASSFHVALAARAHAPIRNAQILLIMSACTEIPAVAFKD